jgi:hypothetical protein
MKTLIGYYNEQGKYIEELVNIVERTNEELIKEKEELIKEKEEMILVITEEIKNLKEL